MQLSSYKYKNQEFEREINEIRDRIQEVNSNKSILRNKPVNNIEIKDISLYLEQIWKTVRKDEDLNVPS